MQTPSCARFRALHLFCVLLLFGGAILNAVTSALFTGEFRHVGVDVHENSSVLSAASFASVQVVSMPSMLAIPDEFLRVRKIAASDSAGSIKGDGPPSRRANARRGAAAAPVRLQ